MRALAALLEKIMRTLFVLLALAGTAGAETITIEYSVGGSVPQPPTQARFWLFQTGQIASHIGITVPGIDQSDVGVVLTIDGSNAATYGLNWADFVTKWDDDTWDRIALGFGAASPLPGLKYDNPNSYPSTMVPSSIQVEVLSYVWMSGSINDGSLAVRVIGDGTIVPEPTMFCLMAALVAVHCCRRSGMRTRHP